MKKLVLFALCMSLAVMSAGCGSDAYESADVNTVAVDDARDAADEAPKAEADVPAPEMAPTADSDSIEASIGEESEKMAALDSVAFEGEDDYSNGLVIDSPESPDVSPDEDPFGILTAGRWNDNSNWGFFTNIVDKELVSFPSYGLDPCSRVSVNVKNDSGEPVVNSRVILADESGNEIWSSVTGNDGTAYLFSCGSSGNMKVTAYSDDGSAQSADVTVEKTGGDSQGIAKKVSSAQAEITLNSGCETKKSMQVMFIVDATGSMADEMFFLQKDFSAIARDTMNENTEYSVNFYRDEGDEYVTKCFDFSKDIKEIQKNINEQSADGGGDFPEAVAEILDETMNSGSWKDDASKVAFLIFDAPPHDGKEEMIKAAVKTASEKGIHLVPVVSSNADRNTELFGRAAAAMTNGEYVFLTDDSGIGESHLEPIIGDYEVEKLYDIIVDIIREYRQ